MEDIAGVLDPVLGRLLGGGEAVVAGATEVLVAAGSVLQPVGLPRHDGLLLGDAARAGKGGGGSARQAGLPIAAPPPRPKTYQTLSFCPNMKLLLRWVMARSTA